MRSPRRPCSECPWRKDTPPGQFPPERYEALRETTGSPGADVDFAAPQFGCHKAPDGGEFVCAGWLAAVGYYHLGVRINIANGHYSPESLQPGDGWPELYSDYAELLAVHGAKPPRVAIPFYSDCVGWPPELLPALRHLIDNGEEITERTFRRRTGENPDPDRFPDGYSYWRLRGLPIYWYVWSLIEFVYADDAAIEVIQARALSDSVSSLIADADDARVDRRPQGRLSP